MFSVLLGQLNVVEDKIEAIVLYYPLLATHTNSSQSDTLQVKSGNESTITKFIVASTAK